MSGGEVGRAARPAGEVAIGIDIGGTKMAFGMVDAAGRIFRAGRVPTPGSGEEIVQAVIRESRRLRAELAGNGAAPRLAGVGIGTGGIADAGRGIITHASDLLAGWAGLDVAGRVAAALDDDRAGGEAERTTVLVDNDGNTFALAEAFFGVGAGRPRPDGVYVAVGTGIGGGVILDGRLRRGAHFMAGELGHLPFPTPRRCSCGRVGHLEAVASGPSMTAIYRERLGDRDGDAVPDLQAVAARSAAGDALAREVLDQGARNLGRALAGVIMTVDVPLVVLGGGVGAGLDDWYRDAVRQGLWEALPHGLEIPVATAELGPTASVVGAAALVLRDGTR